MRFTGDVFRFDREAREIDPTLQSRWVEWVRSLGIDPDELMSDAVIRVHRASNEYELHVSRVVRDDDGKPCLDLAQNIIVSRPVTMRLGHRVVWPGLRELPVEENARV